MTENGRPAPRSRIAIVTPWFGPDLYGGAERQSFQLAEQLAERGHAIDVLTTCCPSFNDDWERNSLRPGLERIGKIAVRRFRTDRRDRRAFDRVNAILLERDPSQLHRGVSPVGAADAEAFCSNGLVSSALCSFLSSERATYDRFVFLPYMFGTTLYGLPLVAERAFLQPCLHRESYAYLPRVAAAMHAARGLLFNSEGECDVALSLYGPGLLAKSFVVGEGIDLMPKLEALPERVGAFVPGKERYVLFLGRQDPGKNVATLVAAFKAFRRSAPASRLKLVLAGQRGVSYADASLGIVDVGPVSEGEKAALLAACRALAQPSTMESFSRVIYEAWNYARPVIAHADCAATSSAVERSGGGYLADSTIAWENALHRIENEPDTTLTELGRRGAAYAREVAPWPAVVERYERAFSHAETRASAWTDRFDAMPDAPLAAALADGKTNVLFAGPLDSIQDVERLLVVFLNYLTLQREARLSIAASAASDPAVYDALQSEARRLDLIDRLLVTRDLRVSQVQALYLGADAFVSFGRGADGAAEVRDAMWFDIPVIALDTPTHREVAGGAAILIREPDDLLEVAALLEVVATDENLRERVVAAQRRVRSLPHEAQFVAGIDPPCF